MSTMGGKSNEILSEMEEQEKNRKDLNLPLKSLIMQDDLKIKSRTYGEFEMSDAAVNKLCSMYGFSKKHMDILKEQGRGDLVAEQFNHFLLEEDKKMKLRLVDNRVKGIVSANYKPYDDYHVFSQAKEYMDKQGLHFGIEVLNRDDEFTRLRFIAHDYETNMGMSEEGGLDRDIVNAGFELTNSEIGMRGMSVNSLAYRQVCTNGMMALLSQGENEEIFGKRGSNFSIFAQKPMLHRGLNNALEKADNSIYLFRRTKDIKVDNPEMEINRIGNKYNLGKSHVEGIENAFKVEPQNSLFGIVNGVTRHARNIGNRDYNNRSKFEFIASDLLETVAN
jgi:hypothetical protein